MEKNSLPNKYFLHSLYYLIPIKIMISRAKAMNVIKCLDTDGFLNGFSHFLSNEWYYLESQQEKFSEATPLVNYYSQSITFSLAISSMQKLFLSGQLFTFSPSTEEIFEVEGYSIPTSKLTEPEIGPAKSSGRVLMQPNITSSSCCPFVVNTSSLTKSSKWKVILKPRETQSLVIIQDRWQPPDCAIAEAAGELLRRTPPSPVPPNAYSIQEIFELLLLKIL